VKYDAPNAHADRPRIRTILTRAFPLETHMRAYVSGDVVQDASPRIKEWNKSVRYNFTTTGEGGATREDRLSSQ